MHIQGVEQVDAETAQRRRDVGIPLVDVREAYEHHAARIPGSLWVPLSQFGHRWTELPDGPLVLYCAAGARSQQAAAFLRTQGREAANLSGGLYAWARAGLPVESDDG